MARSKKTTPAKKKATKKTAKKAPAAKKAAKSKAKPETPAASDSDAAVNAPAEMASAQPRAAAAETPSGIAFDGPLALSFSNGQSPSMMQYVARLRGIATVSLQEPFTYLELGCRVGMASSLLAAAFPHASFIGIDSDAEQIGRARATAEAGGLGNLQFIEHGMDYLTTLDLPPCDFISLHGVIDRVAPSSRQGLADFVAKTLKPGGLAYVSYNAMPGWAPLQPLRRVILNHRGSDPAKTLENTVTGLQYLRYLRENDAAFFAANPAAQSFLDRLLASEPGHVLRDYFSDAWEPLYFPEVGLSFGQAGMAYCGSTEVERNYTDLIVPKTFWEMLNGAENDFLRESHKSLILNESFRRDLYCKPGEKVPAGERETGFADVVFGSTLPIGSIRSEVRVGPHRMRLGDPIYRDLVPVAIGGGYSLSELMAHPALSDHDGEAILTAMQRLVASGQFRPFAAKGPLVDGAMPREFRIASDFNRAILRERLMNEPVTYLASPVLGSGIRVDLFQGLMMQGMDQAGLDGTVDHVLGVLAKGTHTWRRGGKEITDPEELRSVAESQFDAFRKGWTPLLYRFGILEAA